jgi:hypothetical protein
MYKYVDAELNETILKLNEVHKTISFHDKNKLLVEIPEQIMALKHIQPHNIVLELGGSIGRNSCIINYILSNKSNHVVVEPSTRELDTLKYNRDINNFGFHIENSAISKFPLYSRYWQTYKTQIPGSTPVNTITFNDFISKYNLQFDTLIIDNEGNFVDMMKDFPNILDNIKLLIIEHDFKNEDDLCYFKKTMTQSGLKMTDTFLKEHKYGPGNGWTEGLNTDPVFVSVWKKQ